jgi:hypothetical protein
MHIVDRQQQRPVGSGGTERVLTRAMIVEVETVPGHCRGLHELPRHAEGEGPFRRVRPRPRHRVAAPFGASRGRAQQRGLPGAGGAVEDEMDRPAGRAIRGRRGRKGGLGACQLLVSPDQPISHPPRPFVIRPRPR